jgi:hypothetical protein
MTQSDDPITNEAPLPLKAVEMMKGGLRKPQLEILAKPGQAV